MPARGAVFMAEGVSPSPRILRPHSMPLIRGDRIGPYAIDSTLGEGGMGRSIAPAMIDCTGTWR